MSLSFISNKIQYLPNGATTVFPFQPPFVSNAHVQVIKTTAGVDATLAETTDYTLTGAGNPAGGTVTCLVAPAAGTTLTIKRIVPYTQLATYVANSAFPAASHEQALDLLMMAVQQLNEQLSRCIKFPNGELAGVNTLLGDVATRTNKKLAFDGSGNITFVA